MTVTNENNEIKEWILDVNYKNNPRYDSSIHQVSFDTSCFEIFF